MEKNNTAKPQVHNFECPGCHQMVNENYMYCTNCGLPSERVVKNAFTNIVHFVSDSNYYENIPDTDMCVSDITDIEDVSRIDFTNPDVAMKFIVDFIVSNIESFTDAINDLKELNFRDSFAYLRMAKTNYDRSIMYPHESERYLWESRKDLDILRSQILEKFPYIIQQVKDLQECSTAKFFFRSLINQRNLKTYGLLTKESIRRVFCAEVLDISVARELGMDVKEVLGEYRPFCDMLSEENIELLKAFDPQKQVEFFDAIPQIKSDIDILAEYNNTKFKEIGNGEP